MLAARSARPSPRHSLVTVPSILASYSPSHKAQAFCALHVQSNEADFIT